ncbi:MAG: hypothetical protein R2745_02195 [Vicinamibacterales bacterium]
MGGRRRDEAQTTDELRQVVWDPATAKQQRKAETLCSIAVHARGGTDESDHLVELVGDVQFLEERLQQLARPLDARREGGQAADERRPHVRPPVERRRAVKHTGRGQGAGST